MKMTTRDQLGNLAAFVFLLAAGLLMTGPFVWMISTSLKLPEDQFTSALIPSKPTLQNYANVWDILPFDLMAWNSMKIAILATIGQVLTCSMGAFVFAIAKFRGRRAMFMILLLTMMVPAQITAIPQFIMYRFMGLYGTQLPLILPSFMGGAFGVFLLRQYFRSIPIELAEAARIDGAGLLRIYWTIYLPLAKPALATLALFAFMFSWNDLFSALVYLPSDVETTTLSVGLALMQQQYAGRWTLMMTAALISVLPIIIAFVIAQRQLVEGISMSGLK